MLEASPDLRLPATIEALDSVLKARLAWRSEHGRDAEQQARTHDLTDDIAVLMRSLKDRRIVELLRRREDQTRATCW
jgi:hypothetical protein